MITSKNVLNHELIGLSVEIKNKKIKGTIIDETKNTLTIRSGGKDKIIPKKPHQIVLYLSDGKFAIKGSVIMQRPYERLKKEYKVKNKWEKILVYKE